MPTMPRYVCHKTVHALKIVSLRCVPPPWATIYLKPADERYAEIAVTQDWCRDHKVPVVAINQVGYYVVYEDGYASWSPVEAFERGYTPIAEGVPDINSDRSDELIMTPSDADVCGSSFTPPRGEPNAFCQLPPGHPGGHDASERLHVLRGAYEDLVKRANPVSSYDSRSDAVEERNIEVITQLRYANARIRELTTTLTNVNKTLHAAIAFADSTLINSVPRMKSFELKGNTKVYPCGCSASGPDPHLLPDYCDTHDRPRMKAADGIAPEAKPNSPDSIMGKENALDAALQDLHLYCGWDANTRLIDFKTIRERARRMRMRSYGFDNLPLEKEMEYWRDLAFVSTAMAAMIDLDMARHGI
jgi:hypothetical protein